MTALALADLGLADPVEPQPGVFWALGADRQPSATPVFPGNFPARMLDAGAAYDLVVDWLRQFAFHRRPTMSQALGWFADLDRDSDDPVPVLLGLRRDPNESERDHLIRAGHQVAIFDQPGLAPTGTRRRIRGVRRRHSSAFFDPDYDPAPSIAVQQAMATSPQTVDRVVLVDRAACSRSVLAVLAHDPSPAIRLAVVRHPKCGREIIADRYPGSSRAETDPAVLAALAKHAGRLP